MYARTDNFDATKKGDFEDLDAALALLLEKKPECSPSPATMSTPCAAKGHPGTGSNPCCSLARFGSDIKKLTLHRDRRDTVRPSGIEV